MKFYLLLLSLLLSVTFSNAMEPDLSKYGIGLNINLREWEENQKLIDKFSEDLPILLSKIQDGDQDSKDKILDIINESITHPHLIMRWLKFTLKANKLTLENFRPYPESYNPGFIQLCLAYKKWPYSSNQILKHIEDAAEADPQAQFFLGNLYWQGLGVPQEDTQAFSWIEKSARQNFFRAQTTLGLFYWHGIGTEKDYEQSAHWYRKACETGYAVALSNLGDAYERAMGVPKDLNIAHDFYKAAAHQGYAVAQCALGLLYHEKEGFSPDYEKALYYYQQAAIQGHTDAKSNLASLYCRSFIEKSIPKDVGLALQYMIKAAASKNENAMYNLKTILNFIPRLPSKFPACSPSLQKLADLNLDIITILEENDRLIGVIDINILRNDKDSTYKDFKDSKTQNFTPITELYELYKSLHYFQNSLKNFFNVIRKNKFTTAISIKDDKQHYIDSAPTRYIFSLEETEKRWLIFGKKNVTIIEDFVENRSRALKNISLLKLLYTQALETNHLDNQIGFQKIIDSIKAQHEVLITLDRDRPQNSMESIKSDIQDLETLEELIGHVSDFLEIHETTLNELFYVNNEGLRYTAEYNPETPNNPIQ